MSQSLRSGPGRPRVFEDESMVDALCEQISSGLGIKEACELLNFTSASTVFREMSRDPEFASRIARAREAQQEAEVEKMIRLADEATPENVNVVKLQIWARQWRAARLAPKKWGDKVQLDVSGKVEHTLDMTRFSEADLLAMQAIMAKAAAPMLEGEVQDGEVIEEPEE